MKILAIGSPKGGVGKTTSSLYFAARIAEALGGSRECPVVGLVDRDENRNLTRSIEVEPHLLFPGVVLLPGTRLSQEAHGLELVILDTPPGMTAIKSLRDADLIVVPVIPSTKSMLSLADYLVNLKAQGGMLKPTRRLLALLPTMVRHTTAHRAQLDTLAQIAAAQHPPLLVLPPIPVRTAIENNDLTTTEYDAPSKELLAHAQISIATV